MELHLIRHPRPDVPAGVCYGRSDLGLLEPVAAAIAHLQPLLPSECVIYASPLARARLLAEGLGQPIIDERLQEMDFGAWELQRFDDIGSALDDWSADPLGFCAPGGESAYEMAQRVKDWLQERLDAENRKPVVVVAHGGPLRVIAGCLLAVEPLRWLGLDFDYARSTRIDCASWGNTLKWFNR